MITVSKFEHNLGPALFQSGLSGLALLKSLTAPQARITERLNELADDVDRARSMLDSGAQLPLSKVVQAADGYNVWAYNYDADNAANDMFATEEPIIRRLLRIAEQNKQTSKTSNGVRYGLRYWAKFCNAARFRFYYFRI